MATVQLNRNQEYTFARWNPYGNSIFTIFTDGTDRAQKPKTFNNKVNINRSNSNATVLLDIDQGPVAISAAMISLTNTTTSGNSGIKFDAQNNWYVGTANDASNEDDFQITDLGNAVQTGARTSPFVGLAISAGSRQLYLPNIASGGGTNTVRWDSATNQITYLTSTRKIKKNIITPNSTVYDSILALQPRYFEVKDSKDSKQYLSFIAEETAAVSPHFATFGPDWAYDETGFKKEKELLSDKQVPMDIDERAIIAALVGKVKQLETRLKILESNV